MTELTYRATEILRNDDEFVVWRAVKDHALPSRLLVALAAERPTPASIVKLEHAYEQRHQLESSWAARPLELTQFGGRPALLTEDPGGIFLDQLLDEPLEIPDFLRLALGVTRSLGALHQRGLIHKDVRPANLMVDNATGAAWLSSFGMTSLLSRHRQSPDPLENLSGALAYMAPEQTGRMNRSIDARSDLYSLGVTLYQLLVGSVPFTASNPMEWVHCHIARQPPTPETRRPGVSKQLSAIVVKLLAKAPEERYQTAAGVESDLRHCLTTWQSHRRITAFALGARDIPSQLLIPETLYGREPEIQRLLDAFERVVRYGETELMLVSGYSGVGKSSVVHELHKALVPAHGLFVSGKFDQYKRDIPYATLAQAFQTLVRYILTQSNTEVRRWQSALGEALGAHGQLIVNLVPELELVIGPQQPVADLPPQDLKHRFHRVLIRFIGVFARPEHPLVLFVDDLQWLDAATLELLEALLTRSEVRNLLLVGAYRDNEVGIFHPLTRTLEEIDKVGGRRDQIVLKPLTLDDVEQLSGDALHAHRNDVRPLAGLVYEKTRGNPFFTIQFMLALEEERLLRFDPLSAAWTWDLSRIEAKQYSQNVADLMAAKLDRLPEVTQVALGKLACLGNVAEIVTMTLAYGAGEEALHAALTEAVRAGLIVRLESAYTFIHDRVQEAAYALIPEGDRAAAHLAIGRVLATRTPTAMLEEQIFEIVNHLNRGRHLVADSEERRQITTLNLRAARRAKKATAYLSALTYLSAAGALQSDDCWNDDYDLAFAIELMRAECEFLAGDEGASARLLELSRRAQTHQDAAAVSCLRQALYTTLDRLDLSVEAGLDYLRRVGIDWSPHPTDREAEAEYHRMWWLLGARSVEEISALPALSDSGLTATIDVLTELIPAGYFTDRNLFCLATFRVANLSLEHGNSPGSAVAYTLVGFLMGSRFHDYPAGFRFGHLSLELVARPGFARFKARVFLNFAYCVNLWTRPIRSGRHLLRDAFTVAQEAGDLQFAGFACYALVTDFLASGDDLAEAQREAEAGLEFTQGARFGLVVAILTGHIRLIGTLRGLTSTFGSFDDANFQEADFENHLTSDIRLANPACIYWIRKLQARFFAGRYSEALDAAEHAERLLWTQPSSFEQAEYQFYRALARCGRYHQADPQEQRGHLEALQVHRQLLGVWALHCPENFANRALLLDAEIARLENRDLEAMRLYEQAIQAAREGGFVQNEALSLELAANFHAAHGLKTAAQAYLSAARACYLRWGAMGKVRHFDEQHGPKPNEPALHLPMDTWNRQLDLTTVLKISRALSGEIVLDRLVEKLMVIALEHAGAERGTLILLRDQEPRIEAVATTRPNGVEVTVRPATVTPDELPNAILHYVIRTREGLVLDDASAGNLYCDDPYVRGNRPKSVLCLPIIKRTKLLGALYLENNLTAHAFTPDCVAVLELLASQAAVSLENARLYADLERENLSRKEAEDKLRRSEAFLVAGQRISHTGSWSLNLTTGQLIWSEESYRLFGCRPGEVEPSMDLVMEKVHPEDQMIIEQTMRGAVAERRRFSCEYRIVMADGTIKHIQTRGRPSEGDNQAHNDYIGTNLNVTERKKAAEALRASEHVARGQVEALTTTLGNLARETDSERFLEPVLCMIAEHLGAQCIGVWEVDPESGLAELVATAEAEQLSLLSPEERETAMVCRREHPVWSGFFGSGSYCVQSAIEGDRCAVRILDPSGSVSPDWQDEYVECSSMKLYYQNLSQRGITAALSVPMMVAGKVAGFLRIHLRQWREFRPEEIELTRALAIQAMLAIELTRLTTQRRQSAVLEERARLARDIHDSLAQGFTGVICQLEAADDAADSGLTQESRGHLARAAEMARYGLTEARRSVRALRIQSLDDRDLCSALAVLFESMTADTSLRADFSLQGVPKRLPPQWEEHLLRIAQEALTNTIRHSRANIFGARLRFGERELALDLHDDGGGFNPAIEQQGFGLVGMRERVAQIGGYMSIQSAEQSGTTITIAVPFSDS